MRLLIRLLLILCFVVALARAGFFLVYAAYQVAIPIEAYFLEAKSAHLAWRVQHGITLYPEWQAGPSHVTNFFGPLYFLLVGGIAWLLNADLLLLLRIGRLVTITCGLIAALVIAREAIRREGALAGCFAAVLAIGSAPMIGFGAMTRPDVMADLLGIAGFFLCVGGDATNRGRRVLGASLLVAAIFTKQTTALYLASAVLAVGLTGGWRRAMGLAIGSTAAVLGIVAAVSLTVEPRFAVDLLGESETPTSIEDWRFLLNRFWSLSRELPIFLGLGVGLWLARGRRDLPIVLLGLAIVVGYWWAALEFTQQGTGLAESFEIAVPLGVIGLVAAIDPNRPRDLPLATLGLVQLLGSTIAGLKLGSDLNYFLGARLPAAMAAGALWAACWRFSIAPKDPNPVRPSRPGVLRGLAILVGLGALAYSLLPGLIHDEAQMIQSRALVRFLDGPGRPAKAGLDRLEQLAENPDARILSDNGLLQLHQGARAPFVDPWLFRVMVATGRISPESIRDQIKTQSYDFVITNHDLFDPPAYDSYDFRLPPDLADLIRQHYRPLGAEGRMFLAVPRDRALEPPARSGG